MGMGIDDTIGNGNGKEWESPCMGMEMALIPTEINSHRRMQCLAYVIVTYSLQCNDNSAALNRTVRFSDYDTVC